MMTGAEMKDDNLSFELLQRQIFGTIHQNVQE